MAKHISEMGLPLRIVTNGPHSSDVASIELGGVDITKHVRRIALTGQAGEIWRLNIDVFVRCVEVATLIKTDGIAVDAHYLHAKPEGVD